MATIEGKCPNCNSLLRLNEENETTTCIFCWAEINTAEGIQLGQDDTGHTYPNEEFPEPDEEKKLQALKAQGLGGTIVNVGRKQNASVPEKRKEGKLTPREKVALQNKPLVKPYCSKEHRIKIAVGAVLLVAVIVAAALPIYFVRENKRTVLREKLPTVIAETENDSHYAIEKQNNSVITIVSTEEVSEEKARSIFSQYAKTYAEVYGMDEKAAEAKVTVRVLDRVHGGFSVTAPNNQVQAVAYK